MLVVVVVVAVIVVVVGVVLCRVMVVVVESALKNLHILLTFEKVQNPLCLPRKTTSERPKVVRTRGAFRILTWKCASRHNRAHFLNI